MAKEYKSVLEAHNKSLKHRLPTAEEQAIEPVYPERYLVGSPGKAAMSALPKIERAAVKAAINSSKRAQRNFFGEAGNTIGGEVYRQNENAAGDTYKKGGMTASRRADGIASRGKTKGRFV